MLANNRLKSVLLEIDSYHLTFIKKKIDR